MFGKIKYYLLIIYQRKNKQTSQKSIKKKLIKLAFLFGLKANYKKSYLIF